MYNGIGLTTARGSGTNGYIQTNKFFVRPKVGKVAETHGKGFAADEGTAGVTRKPNKDILEHDRKRQIELKLVELEDSLIDQGLTDAVIAQELADARRDFEAAAEKSDSGALVPVDKRVLDTQSHQIAARKEKQMETLRAALGIRAEPEENADDIDDEPRNNQKINIEMYQKSEHAFLDRDYRRKKDVEENQKSEKENKIKNSKGSKKRNKKEESKKRSYVDSSSDSDDSGGKSPVVKKKNRKSRRNDYEDSDSDAEKRRNVLKKHKKSKRSARDVSESESDSDSGSDSGSDTSNDSYSSDTDGSARNLKSVEKKHQRAHKGSVEEEKKLKVAERHQKSRKDYSEDSDSASSDDDDTRKKSSRKQVEKYKKSQMRRETDRHSESDSGEGLSKEKQAAKKGRRHDSENDSPADIGMKKKSDCDLEERKLKYKKPDRRHDSDSGDSDSEEDQIKEKQLVRSLPRVDPDSAREQNKSIGGRRSRDQDDTNRQVRRSSPEESFRSLREQGDYKRRKEDRYPEKNDNKDSGLVRRGRNEVSDERRDRIHRDDDEPRRGSRNVGGDFEWRGGDRWRMRTEDDDEQRGWKHRRDEEENIDRSQRRRDDERDNERERQRDYTKRSRYDDSRSSERTRRENERGDVRARRL